MALAYSKMPDKVKECMHLTDMEIRKAGNAAWEREKAKQPEPGSQKH
jgi:hypothetical protein